MPIMSDKWIKFKAENDQLIVPFHAESRSSNEDGTPVTSYGLSSFGYDIRLGNIFRFFNRGNSNNLNVEVRSVRDSIGPDVIDPVNFNEALTSCHELRDDECITIPPHGFMLGVSKERIKLGNEFTAICMEKSTLARCGLCVTVTPLEAGWEGYVTLELSNKTDSPIKLTPGMGICQVLFIHGNEPCEVSYADRNGKYQDQPAEPVLPRRKM